MEHSDEHDGASDGEHSADAGEDRHRIRSASGGGTPQSPKLVPVKGTGLSGPFIRRPVMTVLLTLSVIVAGIVTYDKLAVNDLPAVDYPIIQVTCAYPGADPVTMANNIATPLEKQFLQIPGLDIITSSSTQSNTQLTLQFVLSKSITDAATDVQAAIQRATGKLPIDLPSPPTFSKTNPNDQAVYLVGFMSDTLTDGDLYKYASTVVAQRMAILPGVSQVNIYGVQGAIRIKADPAALASRGLTMDDLANAIKAGTVYSGAGQFDGPHRTFVLQPNGQIDEAEGYRNLIIARNKDRSPVYLRDIAEVKQGVQDERTSRFFWVRGFKRPPGTTVVLAVSRQAGANAVEVANSVKALFPELRASLPGSISFLPVFDRSQTIVNSVHDVRATLMIAFVLVVMVIYVFLGRATDTLIPAVALPLSLLLTFAVMYMLGFSINNLTLMALTLAVGFLVDDAIVFLENVIRRAEHGESILKAAYNTAGEISFTILSMTLSLAAVFIPLVFLPGLLGRIFQEFSITIIVAILASGLISLTLTPLMCARILGERRAGHKKARMERWTGDFIKRVIAAYSRALGQIPGPGVADNSDFARLYYRPCLFLHPFAFYSTTSWRQRFCSRCFHYPGGCLARADARVSKTGERESPGGAEHSAIFHERWNRIAERIVAGNYLLRFQAARATRSDRAMSVATAKIDQHNSRPDRGYLAKSGFANQCRRDQPNPGTVRLHS